MKMIIFTLIAVELILVFKSGSKSFLDYEIVMKLFLSILVL